MDGQISLNLDTLATALRSDASLIPLQRRIRRCRAEIYAILDAGVTVRALAEALAERGVTDQHGNPLSYGHCRVLLVRIEPTQSKPPFHLPINIAQGIAQPVAATPKFKVNKPDFSQGLISESERNTHKNEQF